jgi:transcriptional regulator with XRE-family HTH domain
MIILPGELIRNARVSAGLTQAELANRVGTTQSAVARMEARSSNPSVRSLERVLGALGLVLRLEAAAPAPGIDETMIAANLKRTPAERLAGFTASYRNMARVVAKARPVDG